jgi:hypothetical protein
MKNISSPFILIKNSVDIFIKKENMLFLLKVYLPLLPFSLVSIILQSLGVAQKQWASITLSVVGVFFVLLTFFVDVAGIEAVKRVVGQGTFSVKSVYKVAYKKYLAFFLVSFTVAILDGVGFLLVFVPGIIFSVWFAFARIAMIDANLGVKGAILKSKAIVKGRFWRILGIFTVFIIIGFVVQFALGVFPYGIGSAVFSLLGALFILPTYLLYRELI